MAFEGASTVKMETDEASFDSFYSNKTLRRWNSSPLINNSRTADSSSVVERVRKPGRTRTFSASMYNQCDSDRVPNSVTPVGSPASRVSQLKQEESIDDMTREVLSERSVTSEIQLSQSWGGMSLLAEKSLGLNDERQIHTEEPRSLFFLPVASTSPSRIANDQRFLRARSLTPSPGPLPVSPRCRTFRRSLSPNGLKPSAFVSKRKIDPDEDDVSMGRQKKLCTQTSLSSASSCSSPDHHTFDSVNISFDEDSGSEYSLSNYSSASGVSPQGASGSNSFYGEAKNQNTYPFLKPKYIAPPSPLATGMISSSLQHESKKGSTNAYTFTPVNE